MQGKPLLDYCLMTAQTQTGLIERMFAVGAHFGYSRSRRHPTTTPYIFGSKNKVEIFDLEKTSVLLAQAKMFMETLGKEGKTALFVGGKNEAGAAVKALAEDIAMPYVAGRWIGGTLTNFSEIKKRLDRLATLLSQRESGELAKYTKKERLLLDREIENLTNRFGGIARLTTPPSALVIVDTRKEDIAVLEAHKMNIPVVGILNSDCDMTLVTHPIVGNDASRDSITFLLSELTAGYKKGLENKSIPPVA